LPEEVWSGTKVVIMPSPANSIENKDGLLPWYSGGSAFGGHILYTSGTTGTYKNKKV
jgi:hypothetical protein